MSKTVQASDDFIFDQAQKELDRIRREMHERDGVLLDHANPEMAKSWFYHGFRAAEKFHGGEPKCDCAKCRSGDRGCGVEP